MCAFDFEGNIRNYSKKNAFWLGKASQIAYKSSNEAKSETASWGLNEFVYFDYRDTQGFLAGNKEVLFIAFRGTKDLRDWMTDLDVGLVGGPGGKVHEGFLNALGYVWRDIWQYVQAQRQRRSLWVTGHSLGAALATLAVAKLRLEKDEAVNGLYTFGQPRTGDREFAKNFDADFLDQTFRYVNNNDIVTRVPFRTMNYSHVGTFKYFDENGDQRDNISWWDKVVDRVNGRIEDLL
ncbi:MAG TPA: lipase family protein [Candidatus Brocadiaceae bacterium]|nr:lipase family protein [Candidatus Brocadiaceae bacterium]